MSARPPPDYVSMRSIMGVSSCSADKLTPGHRGEPCAGDLFSALPAEAIQATRDSIQRIIDIRDLDEGRLADCLAVARRFPVEWRDRWHRC